MGQTMAMRTCWCSRSHLNGARCLQVITPLRAEGLPVPSSASIVVVDNSDAAALREAVGRARLCLNCTGPYRFLGEAVVSACVDVG